MSNFYQNKLEYVLGDAARKTKFEIEFTLPIGIFPDLDTEALRFLVTSSVFPSVVHVPIEFKYKGRNIPIKGQTNYTQIWNCNFYLSEDHALKTAIENWMQGLDQTRSYSANIVEEVSKVQNLKTNYRTTMSITQYDFSGLIPITKYTLYNAFPRRIDQVQVSHSDVGQVQEFGVEFAYSHFDVEVVGTKHISLADKLMNKAEDAVQGAVDKAKDYMADAVSKGKDAITKKFSQVSSSVTTEQRAEGKSGPGDMLS